VILTSNCKSSKSFAVLGPVHTSNIVEATFDFVEATFDFVATNGNNAERFYCKISSFRQSRNKLNIFNLFRHCRKDEISFDIVAETGNIVAKNGNNVEATLDIVERIVQLVAFDNIAWALLLVWTGFNWNRVLPGPNGYKIPNAFLLVCLLVRRFKLSKL